MLLRKIARPLLGAAFITSGIDAVRAPAAPARVAEPLLESAPLGPETAVRVAGAVQIGAGVALATGRAPRIASTVLVGTLVPTTIFASDFWNETDPAVKRMKQSAFVKNLGLLGGAMLAAADTEGKPSLGWRGRRRLSEASAAVEAALPGHRGDVDDTWHELTGRASTAAHEVASHVPVDEIRGRFSDLADTVRTSVADAADAAPGVVASARQRVGAAAEELADRVPEAAAEARDLAVSAGAKTQSRARRWRRDMTA